MEDLSATLLAMRRQEAEGYTVTNYLGTKRLRENRHRMINWYFGVIDICKFQRETASVAVSYLDRYLMSPGAATARYDSKIFQL